MRSKILGTRFWFSLSLTFAVIYSLLGWREAFGSEYVVQDDARQHVFWMLRFVDPQLFPQDLLADYFQSVAPPGYTALYQMMAAIGINPLLLNKLLPPLLGVLTTGYCFGVCLEILPLPAAGFTATLLLNQIIWMKDDLVSATPRAFAYPLFLAFLYYLLRRYQLGVAVAIALLGLFYPQYVLVAAIILILRLWDWENGIRLSPNRSDRLLCYIGIAVTLLVMLPYALKSSEFAPAITAEQARQLPEFLPGGRTQFFHENPWKFWLNGQRSGILPRQLFQPLTLYAGLLLPLLLRFPSRFPLVRQVTSGIILLPQLALASLFMFFAAHALLFKLHVPSRYTGQSLRIIMALATAIALIVIVDAVRGSREQGAGSRGAEEQRSRGAEEQRSRGSLDPEMPSSPLPPIPSAPLPLLPHSPLPRFLSLALTAVIAAALVLYPTFVKGFPLAKYRVGEVPALYEFFQKQPSDITIASLAEEANNLPSFSQRSILVGRKYAIPYQVGYYRQFRQRTLDLIRAQYSQDSAQLQNFIQKYKVDFWLLDRSAFTPGYLANNDWIRQYQPAASEALLNLEQGTTPALSRVMQRCSVFETESLVVLEAACTAWGEGERG